ncbi:hypothetical protein MAPG_05496 [Magnaporthiopsis poae ATCC 64411]|uniref:Uncharacterized protein n=1 Tax=Magnaporthiopsis poae (strain ATCC 64411 / 73-15) TaxID=644358 RepID=A0A0C4DZJ4_MAGP6|nr:hypothetical protein MAPG_05496 [Magnaporthiopsis poae ATCC 64411]
MTASAEPRAPLADLRAAQDIEYISPANPRAQPLLFKKRKLLPHPRPDSFPYRKGLHVGLSGGAPLTVAPYHDATTAAPRSSRSQSPRPRPALHQPTQRPKRVGTGPDMPPTPPAHSRTSSSSHSAVQSSPAQSPDASTEQVQVAPAPSPPRTPTTPTKQRSPPTPDVTPPQLRVGKRPGPVPVTRPVGGDRILSRSTTASGADSFMTARETMSVPEEDDVKPAVRPKTPSVKTSSQSTLRRASRADGDEAIKVNGDEEIKPKKKKKPKTIGLGLGLESSPESDATATPPRRKDRFVSFDGEWSPGEGEVEKQWDDNLERNVTVRKQLPVMNGHTPEILEDNTVLPTSATEALRSMSLPERALAFPSPLESPAQNSSTRAVFPLQRSPEIAARRLSTISSYSTTSTVLDGTPKRQRTLRHVRKVDLLRDSRSELSQSSSATVASVQPEEVSKRRPPLTDMRLSEARHASYISTSTTNSISSRKARRDVCKNGGIPVVVVPERRSSLKSESRTPSLRSTRSSRRSQSVGSAPLLSQMPKGKDLAPYFDRPSRRGRAMSESDGSQPGDERTMDYPPIVPRRTSSLSAPTSRNTSRAGSLTAENLRDLQAFQAQTQTQPPRQRPHEPGRDVSTSQPIDRADPPAKAQAKPAPPTVESTDIPVPAGPEVRVEPAPSVESVDEATRMHPMHKVSIDHHGDPLFGRRLSAQHTPFSQHSVDTNATSHAEVSEAMAVNIYPHQNTSVLMVNHSNKPSLSSSSTSSTAKEIQPQEFLAFDDAPEPPAKLAPATTGKPIIRTVDMDAAAVPATPPQPIFSMDDVDSPLRNPRAPPEPPSRLQPPAIEFIPATPSGLTPAQEKQAQLGNFYEALTERPPARRMSLVRRALSLRQSPSHGPTPPRSSSSGFISRALSLSRGSSLRRDHSRQRAASSGRNKPSSKAMGPNDEPADETRLHPFWRPAYAPDSDSESDSDGGADLHERTYRYPPIDNRPRPPRLALGGVRRRDGVDDGLGLFVSDLWRRPRERLEWFRPLLCALRTLIESCVR